MKRTIRRIETAKLLLRHELCRRKFWQFCLYYDREFFESRPFLLNVASAFQRIEDGEIKSLSVSLPARAGKSYITSLFCAWVLGRNPSESIMRNTCTATLYLKFSYDVRAILKNQRFRLVFPNVSLSDDKANLQGWNTNQSKQVGYFGAGVGGTIIGFGASKLAISDDLYRGIEDALSDTINDRIIQWKTSTHDSRFEKGCSRIDIGTRWSINDVIGRNIESKIYDESIIIPALDENDKSFCENVLSTDEYLERRKHTNESIWLAEYQQQPVDIQGRLFSDLKLIESDYYNELIKTNEPIGAIAYIDVSDTGKDFTACAVMQVIDKQLFIVDYLFNNLNADVTIQQCADLLNKYNVNYCRVESNSMGAMFGRNLQKLVKTKILPIHNTTNKITRILMQSGFIIERFNFVKYDKKDFYEFMSNVYSFSKEGKNKNDDAPDCLAGLSMFVQSMFKNLV